MCNRFLHAGPAQAFFKLFVLFFLISCSRKDEGIKPNTFTEKLFPVSTIADRDIRLLAAEARKQDEQKHFSETFLRKMGQLLWNRAEKTVSGASVLAFIPFATEGGNEVNGFLVAKNVNSKSFSFMVYRKDRIPAYGFNQQHTLLNAFQVLSLVNYFNHALYHKKTFYLGDRRLIPGGLLQHLPQHFETARLKGILKEKAAKQTSLNCFSYTEEVEWWYNPDGDECNCNGDEYYVYTIYETHTYCYNSDDTGSGDSDWLGGGDPGSGGSLDGGGGTDGGGAILTDPASSTTSVADEPEEITDNDPDLNWWNDYTTTFPQQSLPTWNDAYAAYPKDPNGRDLPGSEVYALVGGQIFAMYQSNPEKFRNACALRISRALNYSGVQIPNIQNSTFAGGDGKYYFLSAAKLFNWMVKTFGTSHAIILSRADGGTDGSLFQAQLAGNKGIYIMQASAPGEFHATGHASLFDGNQCISNHCYFNARGGVEKIILWKLN